MSHAAPLAAYFDALRVEIDAALARVIARLGAPALVAEAMGYAVLGGGKRLRPCLTLASASAVAPTVHMDEHSAESLALPAAVAVELVHAYSLVHDDLPAMDNDTLRRGRPTSHVVYGDGIAILAGDGLLTAAFAVLAQSPSAAARSGPDASDAHRLQAMAVLAMAAGAAGMVGGQAIDLAFAGRVPDAHRPAAAPDRTSLADMHARKTGALFRAAATMGAIVTGASDAIVAAIDDYARELGLAFQVIDDVLDVEGSNDELGKTAGKDAAEGKLTYPALYGLEGSRRLAAECVERATAALAAASIGGRLAEIARWSLSRRR